jgi:hypothetical protein
MGSDRAQPFENRLREWLGEAADQFDIVFVVRRTISPRDYSADAVVKHQGSVEDIAGWRELFKQWGVEALAYGYVVIQMRRNAGPKTGPAEVAWLVDWATSALDVEKLLESKPRARAGVMLHVEHRFKDCAWQPESFRLESEYPFQAVMQAEPWTANLLTLADGTLSVRQLLDQLLGDSIAPEEFARAVGAMISAGLLELDEHKLPAIH